MLVYTSESTFLKYFDAPVSTALLTATIEKQFLSAQRCARGSAIISIVTSLWSNIKYIHLKLKVKGIVAY